MFLGAAQEHGLSIPAWFDWRADPSAAQEIAELLSIPAWFDWRREGVKSLLRENPAFNPSLVRLAPPST